MDAAISGEYKDLKFKNSTKYPVYIEGYTDGGIIHFNVYGKETRDANREVEFVSETTGETDPGVKYVADGTLQIGTISTQQSAHIGKKAKLWKVVKVNGKEESREVFNTSNYQASPKIVRVGTASHSRSSQASRKKITRMTRRIPIKKTKAKMTIRRIPRKKRIIREMIKTAL